MAEGKRRKYRHSREWEKWSAEHPPVRVFTAEEVEDWFKGPPPTDDDVPPWRFPVRTPAGHERS